MATPELQKNSEFDCGPRRAVGIEPSLRRQSPKNGNIRGKSWRLSANWPRIGEFGSRDSRLDSKSPPLAGFPGSLEEDTVSTRMPGWRRSADRARLHAISLLSGNLTGNSAILRHLETVLAQETGGAAALIEQFPTQANREIISGNRDF
jgi:hypothetical protein